MDYFKTIQLMGDMRRGLDLRQLAMDSGVDSESLEKMNGILHRKLELLEFVYRKLTIQCPLQSAFLLFSEGQLKQFIEQQRNALRYTGIPCTTFDYYLDLPGYVVREKILTFLTNPQDLLNLLLAIPTEQKFAPLTKEELEFELAFPEMLYNNSEDEFPEDDQVWEGDESWKNLSMDNQVRILSLRSKHHRQVILRRFEDFLVNDISNTEQIHNQWPFYDFITINNVVRSMEGMALEDWNKCPTASQVDLYIGSGDGYIQGKRTKDMQMVGSSIWHAKIRIRRRLWVDLERVLEPSWRKVCRYLLLMPQLRNLYFHHEAEEDFEDEEEVGQQFEWIAPVQLRERSRSIQLPELPFLKSINFYETRFNNDDTFRMLRMLLERYGGQLNQFVFTIDLPTEGNNIQFPVDLPPCKSLSLLSFIDESVSHNGDVPLLKWQTSETLVRFMSNFREAPLKKIKLSLNDSNPECTLYRLLGFIGRTFGNSLEGLEMEFGTGGGGWPYRTEAPSLALLEEVQFGKLVHFATNLHATWPKGHLYQAVLRFPVLETLEVGKYLWHMRHNEEGWSKQFSGDLKGENLNNWKVGVWKELPKLKWIGHCQSYWYQEEDRITREEVEGM